MTVRPTKMTPLKFSTQDNGLVLTFFHMTSVYVAVVICPM